MQPPYFMFNPKEFLANSRIMIMRPDEIGAYVTLTSIYWIEGHLPNDLPVLAEIAKIPLDSFQKSWNRNISKFFTQQPDGTWVHTELQKERNRARSSASITSTHWKEIRKQVLLRDNFTCAYCGDGATTVDHIIPRSRGGNNDPQNLVSACITCNSSKKDRTPKEAGMKFLH